MSDAVKPEKRKRLLPTGAQPLPNREEPGAPPVRRRKPRTTKESLIAVQPSRPLPLASDPVAPPEDHDAPTMVRSTVDLPTEEAPSIVTSTTPPMPTAAVVMVFTAAIAAAMTVIFA